MLDAPRRGLPQTSVVEVSGLSKSIAGRPVLSEVDLTVAAGEVVAVVGPHGCGKSTLLRILVDLLRPSSGAVTVLGTSSRRGARLRRQVGYLPAPVRHDPHGSVRAALSYAARLSHAPSAPFRALASRFALPVRSRVGRLDSNGAQLLGLVEALGHAPTLALLDEPSTALDATDVAVLLEVVDELRTAGSAVVIASHRLDPFADLVDHVVLLKDGSVALEGSAVGMRRSLPVTASIRFAEEPSLDALRVIDPHLEVNGHQVTLRFGSQPGRLLTLLAGMPVESVEVTTPRLSDALLPFYGEDPGHDPRSVIGDDA